MNILMSRNNTIKPKCDMLLDQNKYIGSDPIGHCCYNDAKYQTDTHFICEDCKKLIENESDRITFGLGSVIGWKERVQRVQSIIDEHLHPTIDKAEKG